MPRPSISRPWLTDKFKDMKINIPESSGFFEGLQSLKYDKSEPNPVDKPDALAYAYYIANTKNDNSQVCETCQGEGECMQMVCYGNSPVERMKECPDCNGNGTVELPNDGHIPMRINVRERDLTSICQISYKSSDTDIENIKCLYLRVPLKDVGFTRRVRIVVVTEKNVLFGVVKSFVVECGVALDVKVDINKVIKIPTDRHSILIGLADLKHLGHIASSTHEILKKRIKEIQPNFQSFYMRHHDDLKFLDKHLGINIPRAMFFEVHEKLKNLCEANTCYDDVYGYKRADTSSGETTDSKPIIDGDFSAFIIN